MGNSCSRGAGNSPLFLEQAGLAIHLDRRVQEKVGQRGMEVFPGDDLDCGADQADIMAGNVTAEIYGALGKVQLVQIGDAAGISVSLGGEVEKPNGRRQEERAHKLGRREIPHQEDGVNLAGRERLCRVICVQVFEDGRAARYDVVCGEQGQGR